jgi:hypothetical protein
MKKKLILNLSLIIISIFFVKEAYSQQRGYIEDYRVLKYQSEIYKYLIKQKVLEADVPFSVENFNLKVQIIKCLEVYSDTSKTNLLLIRFGRAGDHMSKFWGIFSDDEKYFFYDADDAGETDIAIFEKKHESLTIETILFYCARFPEEEIGFVPKYSFVYHQKLTTIKSALQERDALSVANIDSARFFLENITGIKSESNYPTRNDYTNWLNWYRKNYERLYWDNKDKKVKVKK